MAVLVDAGPLIAESDPRDPYHRRVRGFFESTTELLLVPITVVPEVCHFLGRRPGPQVEVAFIRALAGGELAVEPVTPTDMVRAADLMHAYVDLPLGFVDASVVALAERLGIQKVVTLDQRHFRAVRPRHVAAFELFP